MSNQFEQIKRDIMSAMKSNKPRTEAYDTTAEVLYEDDDALWVRIPGGAAETPVEKSIAAKTGDIVQVRVANGRAWINGNNTAPPTDDTQANHATTIAEQAQTEIAEQKEFFYHDENGAHVRGEAYRNDIKSDGMSIVENSTDNVVAKFGAALIELGKNAVSTLIRMCAGKVAISADETSATILAQGSGTTPTGGLMMMDLSAQHSAGSAVAGAEIYLFASADRNISEIDFQASTVQFRTSDVQMSGGKVVPQSAVTTWTAPTITSSSCTRNSGGYFAEGKHTYIQMRITLAASLSANTALQIMEDLPVPSPTNGVLNITFSNNGGGAAYVDTSGDLWIKTPYNVSASTSTNIYITGHYVTA